MLSRSRNIVLALSALFFAGCSAGYNCKGLPEGVSCLSAREVYDATEYADFLGTPATPEGAAKADKDKSPVPPAAMPVTPPMTASAAAVQGYLEDNPLPIRMPEQVMEIWIAPWEDTAGSLHMATTIYTEIEPRKWVVGERTVNAQAKLSPLDVRVRDDGTGKRSRAPYQPPEEVDLSTVELQHPLQKEQQPTQPEGEENGTEGM